MRKSSGQSHLIRLIILLLSVASMVGDGRDAYCVYIDGVVDQDVDLVLSHERGCSTVAPTSHKDKISSWNISRDCQQNH